MSVATVRVKVKPCKGNEAGIVILNEADYLANKDKYELYDPAKEPSVKAEAADEPRDEQKQKGKR